MLAQDLAGYAAEPGELIELLIQARHHDLKALTQVPDDDLEIGMALKRAGKQKAQDVDCGVAMPAPSGQGHPEAEVVRQAGIQGVAHRLRRSRGMQIDGNV